MAGRPKTKAKAMREIEQSSIELLKRLIASTPTQYLPSEGSFTFADEHPHDPGYLSAIRAIEHAAETLNDLADNLCCKAGDREPGAFETYLDSIGA